MIIIRWKYCSFCGNLGIKKEGSVYLCPRCDWRGVPDEGDMSIINVKARAYKPGTKFMPAIDNHYESSEEETDGDEPKSVESALNRKPVDNDGYKANIVKRQPSGKAGSKQQELMERLKKKGGTGDYDFL